MPGIFKNSLLVCLGIAALSRKKLFNIYDTLKSEGETLKNESPILKKRWQRLDIISEQLEKMSYRIVNRLNIATKAELTELNKKIERILKKKEITE